MNNPFDSIDPIKQKKLSKYNEIKRDVIVEQFIEIIKDKDRKALLEINEILIKRLKELRDN